IGKQIDEGGSTIPAVFGRRVPNPVLKRFEYTAEAYLLWVSQVAPVVLSNRFEDKAYYTHLAVLAASVNACLSFSYPAGFAHDLRNTLAAWVVEFERLYYRGRPERVGLCPVMLHSVLHVADCIESAGPVWAYWAFGMERFCGKLQRCITGRRNPYLGIDRFLLHRAQWQQLVWKFPQLASKPEADANEEHQLMSPRSMLVVEQGLRNKLAAYLAAKLGEEIALVRTHIPKQLVQWAKLRLPRRGDTLHAAEGVSRPAERDMTYVRYEHGAHSVRYGQLRNLLELPIGATTFKLAVIQPCKKDGQPPPCSACAFKELTTVRVVELSALEAVVGRLKDSWGRWCVLDRVELHHSAGNADLEVEMKARARQQQQQQQQQQQRQRQRQRQRQQQRQRAEALQKEVLAVLELVVELVVVQAAVAAVSLAASVEMP
ncbi:hypothetical protein CALCODRAFT_487736, partial [Calocera cornea HHB12733]